MVKKLNYTEEDVKKMAVNAYQMREICRARETWAFRSVCNNCSDLENVDPKIYIELKERVKKQQQIYEQTKNPNCFTKVIEDIEEFYGRAFKIMVANLKEASKSSPKGS